MLMTRGSQWVRWTTAGVVLVTLIITLNLVAFTGLFRPYDIDIADQSSWTRDAGGVITGHDSFTYTGTTDHCWLLIHSFAATPDEMRGLAERLSIDLGQCIVAPRLNGHATLPSDVQRYTMEEWYTQVENAHAELAKSCDQVSVVGSSIGGALALALAERHDLAAVYAVNPYLYHTPVKWHYFGTPEWYMETFEPLLHFVRRRTVAQIADPVGLSEHVAYYHLPVRPMVASKDFFATVERDLPHISEPLLILHSISDPVSDFSSTATNIHETVSSSNKKLIPYSASEHILLRDYDREDVIDEIVKFAQYQ